MGSTKYQGLISRAGLAPIGVNLNVEELAAPPMGDHKGPPLSLTHFRNEERSAIGRLF